MLTLNDHFQIPSHVSFSIVGADAFLLNMRTNKYFRLEEVGARLWSLLSAGESLDTSHQILLKEYKVDPVELESDLLELMENLHKNGLVELVTE